MAAHPIKERRNKIMCGIVGYVGAKECTAILQVSPTMPHSYDYDAIVIGSGPGGEGAAMGLVKQGAVSYTHLYVCKV